jgi:hypothetical protein
VRSLATDLTGRQQVGETGNLYELMRLLLIETQIQNMMLREAFFGGRTNHFVDTNALQDDLSTDLTKMGY